jgi:hypothetical protein
MTTRAGWRWSHRRPAPGIDTEPHLQDRIAADPDATQPRVTERPKPPQLLGATLTANPASPVPSRVGRPCNKHRTAVLARTPQPVTGPPLRLTYGSNAPCEVTLEGAFRPLLRYPPDFGGASVFRVIDTVMGVHFEVKRVARNPYLFLRISLPVPRSRRDVHRSSPTPPSADPSGQARRRSSSAATALPLAWPLVAFITWPMKWPDSFLRSSSSPSQ